MKYAWVVAAFALALALLIVATRLEPKGVTTAPSTTASTAAPPAEASGPLAKPAVAPSPVAVAVSTTASAALDATPADDPLAHRAEIEAALANKDVSALPGILKTDLTRNGYEAAAAIDAVGKLAALAPEPDKRDAIRTLDRWLKQESTRKAPEALGNVSILVDALADTKSKDAVAPLAAALDGASQPLHIETKIVEALDALDGRSAAPSVARFATRVRARSPSDDFEKALVSEALTAADATLAKWKD